MRAVNPDVESEKKKRVVVSDAAPLIQLSLTHHLHLLPMLYDVTIPDGVFQETQHYRDLPDAIEIAKAAGTWLVVKPVKETNRLNKFLSQKLGKGEAEAMLLCEELHAYSLLTSDRYPASQAEKLGLRTMTLETVIRDSYGARIIGAPEAVRLLDDLVGQNILNTSYLRRLQREAREWP